MTSLNDIRTTFLDFFGSRGHEVVASSPLVPQNDPTLLFTNAGMVQFKNVFTGVEVRDCKRAATAQKCVRAGGKHNDLDNVGYTARHHTFFEMLGNFSFGDYFKDEAITYAWELITKDYGIAPKRLLVTIFAEDEEAYDLWKKIAGLPDDKIIRIATSDNFWAMGETGPCGPCSEIFYDHGDHVPGGPPGSPDEDGDRFIEIWNLVFMQYDQVTKDERLLLPKPSIDTGLGLERMAALMQGTYDNYETDLFRHLIQASAETCHVAADGEHAVSHRVIADHLRSCSFLLADGVLPSNEGRGYVLRRIMRRAMRHAHILGTDDPLLWRLVPALISEMGAAYPELGRAQALIEESFKLEEQRFRQMLARGLGLLDDAVSQLKKGQALAGEVAFKLYDTYGFPLDLTQDALRAQNIEVDTAGFDEAMERQRAEARKAWKGSGDTATEELWFDVRDEQGMTEFLGYDTDAAEGIVTAIEVDGVLVDEIMSDTQAQIVTNQTPFYGESGGQIGDAGVIFLAQGAEFTVTDTQKKVGDLFVHKGKLGRGTLRTGDAVELRVDAVRRNKTRANHSATHLLHAALRDILGPHVTQKGSMVGPDRLRFDFSQPKAVSSDELRDIEEHVNAIILQNEDVSTQLMTPDDAIEARALALFGEKYGDEVRVLSMGTTHGERAGRPYSVELCGGTHVRRLGDIGLFKIVHESAIAAGVRRIEGLTGEAARQHLENQVGLGQAAAAELKTSLAELPGRVAALLEDRKKLEREFSELKKKVALGGGGSQSGPQDQVHQVGGLKVLAMALEGVSAKELRGLIDDGKRQIGSGIVAMIAVNDGKAALAVGVTDDLTSKISAVDLVRRGAESLGGKGGGGRPDMAQAGGPDGSNAAKAIDAIISGVKEFSNSA
jgi:alanyl-tRNA synthetase